MLGRMVYYDYYLFIFFYFFRNCVCDEILGCGGFVKSNVPIDFTKIEIQLYTSEGLLKYQTECAPNNGYYMVPYVEKGSFILKIAPPQGWRFEPMSVELNVDGVNDDCSKGKDINFIFQGFIVTGQISNSGSSGVGPKNIVVELFSSKTDSPIKTTKSLEQGGFIFEGVLPGEYHIRASSHLYSFEKHSSSVIVKNSNTKCPHDLLVSGYNIQGKVTAQQQAVAGVHLLLFAKTKLTKELKTCSKSKPEGATAVKCPGFPFFVCSTTSSEKFLFENIPAAEYGIVPFHQGLHTQYDLEPAVLHVTVTNQHVTSMTDFQVTGYSMQGKVLYKKEGQPISGAEVFINGNHQDTTNSDGAYTIKHKYSGAVGSENGFIDIHIKKEDLEFLHQKVRIDPNSSRLPVMVPRAFSVCGLAEIADSPPGFDTTQLLVEISMSGDGAHAQRTNLDKKGLFCFMKSPGEYNLKIIVSKSLEDKGLVIVPDVFQVKVDSSPVKNVAFSQHRTHCLVRLSCIDSCSGALVTLASLATGRKHKMTVAEKYNETVLNFESMLPGDYMLSVHRDNWCWAEDNVKVRVPRNQGESLIEVAHIKQSGFLLVCSISHDVEMVIHHNGEEVESFSLKKGRNRMCLSRLGKYTLEPRSCHRFDGPSPIVYDTANPRPINLHAVAHQAVVTMSTNRAYLDSNLKEEKISVHVHSSRGKVTKEYFVQYEEAEAKGDVFFRLTYWAGDGEKLELDPSSDLLIFEPPKMSVVMKAGECTKKLGHFNGIVGKFIDGHVTPPLANVNVVMTTGKEEIIKLKTGKDGTYRVGPLHPDASFEISADLDDYAMTPEEGKEGCFLAKKLSKLTFKITLEGSTTPLPGVLLSISGGSYRSNNLTGSDGGLILTRLEPGSYYFKAIMKEYQFNPPSKVIEIIEGAKTEIKVVGRRVAFSAFGSVASLNGEPETGVVVRALSRGESEQCQNLGEEGVADNDGSFRVRGLRPGCTYDLSVRDKEGKFSRVIPEALPIRVSHEDFFNAHFIAMRPLAGLDLSGYVITPTEHLQSIKIALYRADEGMSASPVHVVSLTKESPFFYLPSIPRDGGEYVVKLESSLQTMMFDYTAPAAGFFAVGPHKHLTFRFDPQRKAVEAEVTTSSVLTLPFTLLTIALVYYHEAILAWIRDKYRSFVKKNSANELSARGRKSRK